MLHNCDYLILELVLEDIIVYLGLLLFIWKHMTVCNRMFVIR